MFSARWRSESGQVVIFLAVLLPVAVAFLGFALDAGRQQLARVQLQTAVDAASLAGALTAREVVLHDAFGRVYRRYLEMDKATAEQAAYECLVANVQKIPGAQLVEEHIEANPGLRTVEVIARVQIPAYFAGLVGRQRLEVRREATAVAEIR
ncbi:MAG: TadE/TadG family type IV pilus assembly protein [Bacillota bacterium]